MRIQSLLGDHPGREREHLMGRILLKSGAHLKEMQKVPSLSHLQLVPPHKNLNPLSTQ